jgi:hypothetical protein
MSVNKVFNVLVDVQDKSLTGTWPPLKLAFIVTILAIIGQMLYNVDKKQIFKNTLVIVLVALFINFLVGDLELRHTQMQG